MNAQRTQHIGRRLIPVQPTLRDHQVVSPDDPLVLDQEANERPHVLVGRPHSPIAMRTLAAAPEPTRTLYFSTSMLEPYPVTTDTRIIASCLPDNACKEKWLIRTMLAKKIAPAQFTEAEGLHRGRHEATALAEEASTTGGWHSVFHELGTRIRLTPNASCACAIQAILFAANPIPRGSLSPTVRPFWMANCCHQLKPLRRLGHRGRLLRIGRIGSEVCQARRGTWCSRM